MKKFCIFILLAALLASLTGNVTAAPLTESAPMEEIVEHVVLQYMADRLSILQGDPDATLQTAVPAMERDEQAHFECLQANGFSNYSSSYTVHSIQERNHFWSARVTEQVTVWKAGGCIQETVEHEVKVCKDRIQLGRVWADSYLENTSGFYSCSYVLPEDIPEEPQAGGSHFCIAEVAKPEVGNGGSTYLKWFGAPNDDPWCAIFVSWCANQANVSTSIIPEEDYVPYMQSFFSSRGRYYPSKSQGGNYTPAIGDLFFEAGEYGGLQHVGIIIAVSSRSITVIDGNYNNQVGRHSYSLSSSELLGYASPNYSSGGHSSIKKYDSNYHWNQCTNCDYISGKTAHTMVEAGGYLHCKGCGYIPGGAPINAISRGFCDLAQQY